MTPDISPWVQHSWYDNVWYRDADGESKIGKWLGPAIGIGGGDYYWILPMSARPIARSTVWEVTTEDLTVEAIKSSMATLNLSINDTIGDHKKDDEMEADYVGPLPAHGDQFDDDEEDDVFEEEAL